MHYYGNSYEYWYRNVQTPSQISFYVLDVFNVFVEAPILPVIFISILMSTLVLTSVFSNRKHLLLCEKKKSLTFSSIVLLGIN